MPIRRQQPLWQSACPRTPAQRPDDIHQSRHRREGFWIAIVTERIDPCLVLTVRMLNVEFVLQEDEIPLSLPFPFRHSMTRSLPSFLQTCVPRR